MDVPAALARTPERADERVVVEEGPVADRAVHALEVHVDHATGADRQVADLRVAHLTRRQPDRLAARGERRVRVLAPEPVEDGGLRHRDAVARPLRRAAPAVED